jgi:AbrB family looped-hinge helix DNA binding protein
MGRNGEVAIPPEVRTAANLNEGDEVEVELTEDGILLRLVEDDQPDPWYYGTPEWEAGLTRAIEDAEAGRVTSQGSTEEFFAELDRRSHRADA